MSTRVHDPVSPKIGELVNFMHHYGRGAAYGNVSNVIGEIRGKLTNTSRAIVDVTAPGVVYSEVWVIRDDIGYLHEVPEPVCLSCEETIECKCVEPSV